MNKKINVSFGILFLVAFAILLNINFLSAVGETSYCAERTVGGAWCQNVPLSQVDQSYRSAPTSCESTSYCRLGTCIDSLEGTCLENTPQQVCQTNEGVWQEGKPEDIPQCSLGCCILGDQAAFVTQTRCKVLSSTYGLETDFRSDIQSESLCIQSVTSDVEGACVFEEGLSKTCKFITKKECLEENTGAEFHEGFLCSAESLATNCGPSRETTCVEGRDQVYFVDTCGNLANVYDASKINDKAYWSEVVPLSESCNPLESNADSATCGSCDYFLGSTCKEYQRGEDRVKPNYGDFICRDLSCEYEGKNYEHGETFCADAKGIEDASPGSRHSRLVCYNGEVSVEPCADFRQEICVEDSVNGFSVAACVVNRWQDCYAQADQASCENTDKRDCQWVEGVELNTLTSSEGIAENERADAFRGSQTTGEEPFRGSESESANSETSPITGGAIFGFGDDEEDESSSDGKGACLPLDAPGFNFWEAGDAQSLCSMANQECVVVFEKSLLGSLECIENCDCLTDEWIEEMNNACVMIGDCGSSTNYIGVQGYGEGYRVSENGESNDDEEDEDEENKPFRGSE